ncbi:hypothetical protein GCM10023203_12060 [Actinomycetospora straminea]|uniref:Uncharacterized protein n=1 Tax=Actinomycetospora straminea TaxID=663607 RepID=A0ABP9E497_9PSEU
MAGASGAGASVDAGDASSDPASAALSVGLSVELVAALTGDRPPGCVRVVPGSVGPRDPGHENAPGSVDSGAAWQRGGRVS